MLRFSVATLCAALAFGCSSSTNDAPGPAATDAGADAAADTAVRPEGTADVRLLTITAWQGHIDPIVTTTATETTSRGGLGTLSAYFKAERASAKGDVLFVTGGDEIGATPVLSSVFDDEPAVKALNFLGLQATTFGNHNFDPGLPGLRKLIDLATYRYVSSNLRNVTTELGAKVQVPYWITEVGTSTPKAKVAFLGLTAPEVSTIVFPGKLGSIGIEAPASAANAAAKAARDAGASLVVALAHLGAEAVDPTGTPSGPIVDLANAVTGVDVWVADDTDFKVNATVGGALVVQNLKRGQGYSVVDVKIVDGQVVEKTATSKDAIGSVVAALPSGATCPSTPCPDASFACVDGACTKTVMAADPAADDVLKPYRDALPAKFDVKLATVDRVYERGGTPQIERIGETPLGNLIADALLTRYAPLGAKIAMVNAGGMRSPLPSTYSPADKTLRRTESGYAAGPPYDLVVGDVYTLHTYGNAAVVRKVKGSVLWAALENGFSALPGAFGGFPQIAGFKVVYDPGAPVGSRVVSVTLDDGAAVAKDSAAEIVLATVDFINFGGDGYSMLVEPVPSPTLDSLTTILTDYLRASSPVPAPKSGRLVVKL